jgi:predicted esterase
MSAAPPPTRPIKILMLHGYTQSGPNFQATTTAPIRLTPADETFLGSGDKDDGELDAWAWWKRKDAASGAAGDFLYEGIEVGLATIAGVLKHEGPFDGVVGFSQGAAAAAMVASLLEPGRAAAFESAGGIPYPASFEQGRVHAPLRFAVSYSGFAPVGKTPYAAFYEPRIATPVLHFLGTQDVVVEEKRSLALVAACERSEDRYVVYHPGGHFLPSAQKASVNALVGFVKEVLHGQEGAKKEDEENVEDMDVPF